MNGPPITVEELRHFERELDKAMDFVYRASRGFLPPGWESADVRQQAILRIWSQFTSWDHERRMSLRHTWIGRAASLARMDVFRDEGLSPRSPRYGTYTNATDPRAMEDLQTEDPQGEQMAEVYLLRKYAAQVKDGDLILLEEGDQAEVARRRGCAPSNICRRRGDAITRLKARTR